MNSQELNKHSDADLLIDAIYKKLIANRGILNKSIKFGRLKWRRRKETESFEIDLELNI